MCDRQSRGLNWPARAKLQPTVDGLVSLGLNFGDVFNGEQRYVEIALDNITLSPRTAIFVAPVALFSESVADGAVSRSSLNGAVVNGSISFFLNANSCFDALLGTTGTLPDDVILFSFGALASVPQGVTAMPLYVKNADQMTVRFCNASGSSATLSNVPVRIQTLR
jgi:hypothetical protein